MPSIRLLLIVFFVALGLRFGYFFLIRGGLLGNADSPAYEDLGNKILLHQPYTTSQAGGPAVFPADLERPPGYPFFLSLIDRVIGSSRQHTGAVQCVLDAGLAVVIAILVGSLTNQSAGFMAGLFYATDWVTIIHVPLTIAETLFVVLLGIALCLYALALALPTKNAIVATSAGILLGLAALVKPVGQVIVLAFLVGWIAQKKHRVAVLLFLVSYGMSVFPWMLRNYRQYGLFTLSEVGTVDLYFYTGQASARAYPIVDLRNSTLSDEVNRIGSQWMERRLTPSERKHAMQEETWSLVRGHWPAVVSHAAIGLARTCVGTGFVTAADSFPRATGRLVILLAVLPGIQVITVWLLAFFGAWKGKLCTIGHRGVRVMLLSAVILLLLPAASSMGQSRFRVPAMVPLCMLAGTGGAFLWEKRFEHA